MILRFKGQYDNLDKSYKFRDHIKNNVFLTTHVIKENKVIYMRPGRAASTLIVKLMMSSEEVSRPYYYGRGTNDWLESITDDKILLEYFIFTFVRNPFGRIYSAWRAMRKKGALVAKDFDEFVLMKGDGHLLNEDGNFTNDHWFPQHKYIEFSNKDFFINFIGKVENLSEDWDKIKNRIGCPDTEIKKAELENYKPYYNKRTKKKISKLYKKDLKYFDYEF